MSDNTRGSEWLRRNARPIRIEEAKTRQTESWQRAKNEGGGAQITQLDEELGRYQLQFHGGDHHEVLYVEDGDGSLEGAGACDCEGWRKGSPYGNVCSHIAALRQSIALNDRWDLEVNAEYVDRLLAGEKDPQPDRESTPREQMEAIAEEHPEWDNVDDAVEYFDGLEEDVDKQDERTPDTDSQPDVVDVPSDGPDVPAEPEETFAGPLSDETDDQYVMTMNGETYIRRAGYAVLAKRQNLQVRAQILDELPPGTPDGQVVAIGKVVNDEGEVVAQDYGTAGPPESEDMDGASHNLIELAVTRAATRATAWATGEGLTAVSEVEPGEEVHQP